MSKRFVLVRNPGNSGGSWFMKISNLHDEILMIQEIDQLLRIKYCPKYGTNDPKVNFDIKLSQRRPDRKGLLSSKTICEIAYGFLLDQFYKRQEEVIGLVKGFDTSVVDRLRSEFRVNVVQLVRNPAGIIDYYTSNKTLRQTAYEESEEDCFRSHVKFFALRFEGFLERARLGEKIFRLEDINKSLINKDDNFKCIMEDIYEVEWYDLIINDIILNNDFGDDGKQALYSFKRWETWKQDYFLSLFKNIVKELGYEYR